jgi:hypothetical protein
MKRFITNDDLIVLAKAASRLRKLIKAAQRIDADLEVEVGYRKAADRSIGRGDELLQDRNLTPKKRARLKQQLELDYQFSECAALEYGRKSQGYSAVIAKIEEVLRGLAAIYVEARH